MPFQSSSPPYGLYRYFVLLLALPSLILCIDSPETQKRGQVDVTSLFARSVPDPNDAMVFDDMPSCGRTACLPYQSESLGCPEGTLTRDCYCSNPSATDCADWPCYNDRDLIDKWKSLTCTGIGFSQVGDIPACAQGCMLGAAIFKSCSLKSFDCFCESDLPTSCLSTCNSDDTNTTTAWKDKACADVKAGVRHTVSAKPRTTTISARVSVYTSAGSVVTRTLAPAVTTVVNGNANANTNTINVSTGEARGLFSGAAIIQAIFGIASVHILTVVFRRFV